jgi:hypothetical protein
MTIKTIGLDLAKSVFQAHGVDADGATVLVKKLHRKQMLSTGTEVSPDVGFQNSLPGRFWFRGSAGVVIGLDSPRRAAAAFRRRRRRDEGFRANMLGNEIGMLAQAIA